MKERVVVAMSGGVDSAVAAALLAAEGYEVIGITMCFNLKDSLRHRPICCGLQGIEDARGVAYKLGIKHYVLNMQKILKERVIDDFIREYLNGRTPNPCVRCNQYIKFDALLKKALSLGARFLATGHYARIQGHSLKKAKDKSKDQSYFLYRLNRQQLKNILFPIGDYTKKEVRELARKFGLPGADKPGSQEICFLPDADYRAFLKKQINNRINPGPILDTSGMVLGQHEGVALYTVGQRQGLGIAAGYPLYVVRIDAGKNSLTVGSKEEAYAKNFLVKDPHFIPEFPKKKIVLSVKIRYNHKEMPAEVLFSEGKLRVSFKRPQFAITPGQSAVFYDGDKVIGGGVIERLIDDEKRVQGIRRKDQGIKKEASGDNPGA